MAYDFVFIAAGAVIAALALSDVFQTVVVPGGSNAWLRVAKRLVWALLPLFRRRDGGAGLPMKFAPLVLVASFVVWVSLLILGFGLMAYGTRASFQPALTSLWSALYIAGSSIVTIGMSETSASGGARLVVLLAGFCGLAAITLAVTYLLLVQNSLNQRDTGILKLNTSAGNPPSALALLEKFAVIDNRAALPGLLREARNWCVTVHQSHASHPSLIYFQSIGAGSGWPAALGALIDLALICETLLDEAHLRGPATLLREDASAMAHALAEFAGLDRRPEAVAEEAVHDLLRRLRECGYGLAPQIDVSQVAGTRAHLQACVLAMARHLGKPTTRLVP